MPDCVSVLDVTENEKMQMMREVLEEQFGKIQTDANSPIWKVVLPTDVQFEVDTNTWEVRCQDAVLAAAVAETIDSVNQILFSVCLKFQNSGRFLQIGIFLISAERRIGWNLWRAHLQCRLARERLRKKRA